MRKNRMNFCLLELVMLGLFLWSGSLWLLLFFIFLLVLLFVSRMLNKKAASKIKIELMAPNRAQVGEQVNIRIALRVKPHAYLGKMSCHLSYNNLLYGSEQIAKVDFYSDGKRQQTFLFQEPAESCGRVRVGLEGFTCTDMLGLFSEEIFGIWEAEFPVYPLKNRADVIMENRPRSDFSDDLYDQNKRGNDNTDVFAIREYIQGDQVKNIHWKLSEKIDKMMVKEFSMPSKYHILVLADLTKGAGAGAVSKDVMNHVISMTAAISEGLYYQGVGHTIGTIFEGVLLSQDVDSLQDVAEFTDKLLGVRLRENGNILDETFKLNLWQQYTKIICLSPMVYDLDGAPISQATDFMLVVPSDTGKVGKAGNESGQILMLDVKTLDQTTPMIYI